MKPLAITVAAVIAGLLFATLLSRRRAIEAPTEIVVGGLYASRNEDGTYSISKVLVVDDFAVHVRIYKNRFPTVPEHVDSSQLVLGKVGDPDGFGIGHAPIARDGWLHVNIFIQKEWVQNEELEGYRTYLEIMKEGA